MYLVGSKLLKINNNRDVDYLNLVKSATTEELKLRKENGAEIHTRTEEMERRTLNFELPFTYQAIHWYIVTYQLDKSIIGQDFPIKHSVLEKRDKYIEMLNWIVDNQALNFKKNEWLNRGNCSKIIYHIEYIVFILENNSTVLTDEQKVIVQKIHDTQMPQDYLDELAERIRNLKVR